MELNIPELIKRAYEAKTYSYAPYSNFHVGAALLCKDGTIYTGCNIENAAYTPSNCAERTAVFKAVSEGQQHFCAIAVVGDKAEYLAPCGVCRQVLTEFCNADDFIVILAKSEQEYQTWRLRDLFPCAFSKKDLMDETKC